MSKDYATVGFIGCGTHSTNNLYPMLKYTRARLDAVCDLDRQLAERNGRVFGASHVYTEVERMLDERKLDGVFVVGAPEMHYDVAKKVLARGIPVYVEKPTAPTVEQTQELVALAREKGTFIMTGFMKRHGLPYRKIREMIESGEFVPSVMRMNYSHWPYSDLHLMLLYMCTHPVDLMLSLFGPAESVHSFLYRVKETEAMSLGVTLRFASGRWAQLMLDGSQPRIQERLEISGVMEEKNALIVVDNVSQMELHLHTHNGFDLHPDLNEVRPDVRLDGIRVWRPDHGIPNMQQTRHFFQGFAGAVREFIDAVIEQREPYPSMDDSVQTMRVIDAILKKPDGVTQLL